jgi:hypothetical protein
VVRVLCHDLPGVAIHLGEAEEHIFVITSIGLASFADDDDYVEFIHPQDMM